MKTLTLEEVIAWMDRVIFEGTDTADDFWSNFSDARWHLGEYARLLDAIKRTFGWQE